MYSKADLLMSFATIDESLGCFYVQHGLPGKTIEYCLKSKGRNDILVVAEGSGHRPFAASIAEQAPDSLTQLHPSVFELAENAYGFTHALAVPNTYHGSLKGALEEKRENLFLCIPIYRYEFSGDESEAEFKEMIQRLIPVFDWSREDCPKIRVYFDNPEIDSGTDQEGVLVKYPTLLSLVEDLSGVVSGFIEITNYKGRVVEILSPENGVFTLIRDRNDEHAFDYQLLEEKLSAFVRGV